MLGIREYKSPTKGKDFSQGRLSRVVVLLGSLPRKAAIPLALASVVIFLGGVAVEGKLVLQTDPIQWINPQAQSTKNLEALKAGTGSDNELAANVTSQPSVQRPDGQLRGDVLAHAAGRIPQRAVARGGAREHHRPVHHQPAR